MSEGQGTTTTDYDGARRLLFGLLALSIAVSVVHYADNYLAYDRYPRSDTLPNPSAGLVLGSWFVFTGAGLLGAWWFARRRVAAACLALSVYSGSGLVGLGHYAAGGVSSLAWWRHVHIVADILCGAAVLGFALWASRAFHSVTP